ncbi:MAG: phosphoribosylformylglycinamidine synthase subunit PurL [Planctomycetota bacterium]
MTLWEVDVYSAPGQPDIRGAAITAEAADLGMPDTMIVRTAEGYLLEGDLAREDVQRLARELLADEVVEQTVVGQVGEPSLLLPPAGCSRVMHVLPKPGVMDPVAQSALQAIADFGMSAQRACTMKKVWLSELSREQLDTLCGKVLANESIEQVVEGALQLSCLDVGQPYEFELVHVPVDNLDDEALLRLSREGQLHLTLLEMHAIQQYYRELGRDPTDVELETLAQTWSEHCSHKTLAGRIAYRDETGERHFDNMLKETIFAATQQLRRHMADRDWCVSVFEDNAGIVRFDEQFDVVFKVETHNHPSALEPYGGANTGIGGVIRDPIGTGLGAKPVCNTDVFCFAPPTTPRDQLPPGVLHPRRVMQGVVSGVRDYGNRMGIPTINGAVYFDDCYLGNPLVYCGTVGMLPRGKSRKQPGAGDHIVAIGGRTGRDGIHGATFSSTELTNESEVLSGGAVQIGNPITEKMFLDVLLVARDKELYNAITDCGAGGFSSAVGEMGERMGAEVWLDTAPLKYEGLSYTEIWISEAQERMILSVPPEKWQAFKALCDSEGVEATIIGEFVETGRLRLKYHDTQVADLDMRFLHHGRPPIVREAHYTPSPLEPLECPADVNVEADLLSILGSLNVASKEWIIRQYDHEVQGGSVIKPLVGVDNDGPSDASVVRPVLGSRRGLVVSCGMNPCYGSLDPYDMAASGIDEAVRNCVAVGADPSRIAILDNFCWGYTERPETLGSLVRAALACHDTALGLGTPFISGKDSLNNEFSYEDEQGNKQVIAVPPSLLISALGQVDDVRTCVTMDLKEAGNALYQIGVTRLELGGSHFAKIHELSGGRPPRLKPEFARSLFATLHEAIQAGLVRGCHDLSEGGMAVALAEMAFAGGRGLQVDITACPHELESVSQHEQMIALLFSESNTRFICEVPVENQRAFETLFARHTLPCAAIGSVNESGRVAFNITDQDGHSRQLAAWSLERLKEAWQTPLRWP